MLGLSAKHRGVRLQGSPEPRHQAAASCSKDESLAIVGLFCSQNLRLAGPSVPALPPSSPCAVETSCAPSKTFCGDRRQVPKKNSLHKDHAFGGARGSRTRLLHTLIPEELQRFPQYSTLFLFQKVLKWNSGAWWQMMRSCGKRVKAVTCER